MTEATARWMLVSDGYTEEEKRLARLWLLQRRLFPSDAGLITPVWERYRDPGPLTVSIGEIMRARGGGRGGDHDQGAA